MSVRMDVGVIGLGRMGRGMAASLVRAGHRVRVWNRSAGAADGLDGVVPVASAAEAFAGDAAITMLADDAALRARALENEAQSRAPAPSAGRGAAGAPGPRGRASSGT